MLPKLKKLPPAAEFIDGAKKPVRSRKRQTSDEIANAIARRIRGGAAITRTIPPNVSD